MIAVAAMMGTANAGTLRHVPQAAATADTDVQLVAIAEATTTAPIVLHYRSAATHDKFAAVELVRREADWVATIPRSAVVAPGVDYYLAIADEPVFASAAAPYTMRVEANDDDARTARDLVRSHGARSRIHSSFEYVDFGSRDGAPVNAMATTLRDRYYRIDADFAYRLWAYPLEEIRVGYTRLIGTVDGAGETPDSGFKVAGWFELGLAAAEGVRFDVRGMVLATKAGFGVGTRGELRFGDREGSHIAVGGEYIADVGGDGFFRLGWATVPGLPMAATVEVSDMPNPANRAGVRLFYDIARDFAYGIRAGVRVGYAARTESTIGYTTGLSASVDF